jgi:hypothetical protein
MAFRGVPTHVPKDREEPGTKRPALVERGECAQGAVKGVLDQIFRIIPGRREFPGDGKRRPKVAAHEGTEGLAVPPSRPDKLAV